MTSERKPTCGRSLSLVTANPFQLRAPSSRKHRDASPQTRRCIAFSSDDSGQPEIYVQAFPIPKQRWPVSAKGGSDPKWRRDGRELFYISADRKLMAIPVTPGEVPAFGAPVALFGEVAFDSIREGTAYDVSADGRHFLILKTGGSPPQLNAILNWTSLLKK